MEHMVTQGSPSGIEAKKMHKRLVLIADLL